MIACTHNHKNKTDKFCPTCYVINRYHTNPAYKADTLKRSRRSALKTDYGITEEQYQKMFEEQNGLCALCMKPPVEGKRLVVDHDHNTDKVRGLLHSNCNTFIGLAGEDVQRLAQAIQYLQEHSSESSESCVS